MPRSACTEQSELRCSTGKQFTCSKYSVERYTPTLHVQYFVKTDFMKQYGQYLRRVESQAEEEYVNNLRIGCHRERNQSGCR